MKKIYRYFIVMFMLCVFSISGAAAYATSSSCTIKRGQISAETSAVGASKKAAYKFTIYSDSKAPGNCNCHAAWIGYPYSLENNKVVGVGSTWSTTVTQSKNSKFFAKIFSMYLNNTHGKATVTKK